MPIILFVFTFLSCSLFSLHKYKRSLRKSTAASNEFPVTFRFTLEDWIFIKARLNHKTSDETFFLDTGAPCTYCFETAQKVGLESKRMWRFGGFKIDRGACDAEISGVKYSNLAYMVSDMAFCWKKGNSGIIGANAMQNLIWEFNFRDTTITISDKLTDFKYTTEAFRAGFNPLSQQETPVIKIGINDLDSITAFIDTGNESFLQLNYEFDIKSVKSACPDCVRTSYYNINQMGENVKRDSLVETNFIKARSLGIGNMKLTSPILNQTPLWKGRNLVGLGFLKNFIVTIDWKQRYIYLKPFKGDSVFSKKATYGFKCSKISKVLKVTEIVMNSQIEKKGIKCGEEIFQINNIEAKAIDQNLMDLINNDLPSDKEIVVRFKSQELTLKKRGLFD